MSRVKDKLGEIFRDGKRCENKIVSENEIVMAVAKNEPFRELFDQLNVVETEKLPNINENFKAGATVNFNVNMLIEILELVKATGDPFVHIDFSSEDYPIRMWTHWMDFYVAPGVLNGRVNWVTLMERINKILPELKGKLEIRSLVPHVFFSHNSSRSESWMCFIEYLEEGVDQYGPLWNGSGKSIDSALKNLTDSMMTYLEFHGEIECLEILKDGISNAIKSGGNERTP